ncbi:MULTISPECIES: DUF1016 N-terminal domain-containing protein [unclassified Sulfurospirillum]|uniref:DUF1016 N-terminal domain-containing protein n=1 Tax=unclassified Sulfurospirillum TaxID=2618290 RepID=UPI00068F23F3|nr:MULTISPECIES: DUF1016 N-terminal domain-containing protein [unclassified Sulfurospirillum]
MSIDTSYFDFIQELKQKIYSAKSKAIFSANRLMIELYFQIGKEIVAKQEVLGWGKSIVEQMSKDLIKEFGEKSGYSTQNLWYMRQFYLAYKDNPNLQQAVGEIPWASNILIFSKCKDEIEQKYYIKNKIYAIRGEQVMLDKDLAVLYGVEAKRINEAVKNNEDKFHDDFFFELADEEFAKTRTNPKVFTEQGMNLMLNAKYLIFTNKKAT